MASTSFSPFELLLLKSRNQTDTATLLLLTWVAASKGHLSPADRQRLSDMAAGLRHGHDHASILSLAANPDLEAVQLAAEVLQKDCWGEQALPFLRQAIELATSDGKPSPASHYVLGFLTDLVGVSPQRFKQLFAEITGAALESPQDPSRADYWHAREHAWQQREREQQRSQRQEQHHSQRQRSQHEERFSHGQRQPPPFSDRTLRALTILELNANATRVDIKRAYRRLAQTHHPDRFFSRGESDMATASLRFQKIKKAYEYLMQDARFI